MKVEHRMENNIEAYFPKCTFGPPSHSFHPWAHQSRMHSQNVIFRLANFDSHEVGAWKFQVNRCREISQKKGIDMKKIGFSVTSGFHRAQGPLV